MSESVLSGVRSQRKTFRDDHGRRVSDGNEEPDDAEHRHVIRRWVSRRPDDQNRIAEYSVNYGYRGPCRRRFTVSWLEFRIRSNESAWPTRRNLLRHAITFSTSTLNSDWRELHECWSSNGEEHHNMRTPVTWSQPPTSRHTSSRQQRCLPQVDAPRQAAAAARVNIDEGYTEVYFIPVCLSKVIPVQK